MSRISRTILLVTSVFALGWVAKASPTPLMQNTTTGQTVFHDDFEAYTVPDSPTALNKPTTAEAGIGSWVGRMVFNPFGTLDLGIANTSRSASGKVAAKQGKQFLMMSGVVGDPVGQEWKGHGVVANSGAGDTIEVNIAFNLTSGSNRALFYLYGGPAQDQLLAAFSLNGENPVHAAYTLAAFNGNIPAGFQQTGLSFTPDAWNTMTVKHTNGTATWDVSFNGGTAITVAGYQDATRLNVNAVYFNQTTDSARGTTVYFDAVATTPQSTSKGNR